MAAATRSMYQTDEERWDAVAKRDRRADGVFVYTVRTTGVYCRPACASRLPNRVNVGFFATGREAERAGFRACKKCRPNTTPPATPEAVTTACRLIEEAAEPPTLNELAGAVGLSPFHFHRLFKRALGLTPKAYIAARRAERLQNGLRAGRKVIQALYDAGFGSSSRMYEAAGGLLGMKPTAFRAGGAGETIRFAVADCYLGRMLVAATDRGICCIAFGDSDDCLADEVRARFPHADVRAGEPSFAEVVAAVVAFLDAPALGLGLPLDVQGTAFQRRVWEALRAIPAGSTATYAEVARRIGRPGAARAVASACAANPLAVVIPCHRVIRGDGDVSGYRWGVRRKKELLRREAEGDADAGRPGEG